MNFHIAITGYRVTTCVKKDFSSGGGNMKDILQDLMFKTVSNLGLKEKQNIVVHPTLVDQVAVWMQTAMSITGSFEGNGNDWGNPVGNFDGQYLTCGLLGFTFKSGNQYSVVSDYLKKNGELEARKLMPKYWSDYKTALISGRENGSSIVQNWSLKNGTLDPLISAELSALWSCKGMRESQIQKAWEMFGVFAYGKTLEGQEFFSNAGPKMSHFCYWFDQAVLNGKNVSIEFSEGFKVTDDDVIKYCLTETGAGDSDTRKNATLWSQELSKIGLDNKILWRMAMLRAKKSRDEYDTLTMNRRGSLAIGCGIVNKTFREFPWRIK